VSGRVRPLARLAVAVLVGAAVTLGAAFALGAAPGPGADGDAAAQGSRDAREAAAGDGVDLPPPVEPAFVPGKPVLLRRSPHESQWAVVRRAVRPRVEPSDAAPALPLLSTRTPEGTSNIVLVRGRTVDPAGDVWVRVRLPALGTPDSGWVRRDALGGYGVVRTRLIVDLDSLTATLLRDGRAVFDAPVGVGRASFPTPRGEFYVRNRLTGYVSPAYGPIAFGTSARSRTLTEWPAGGFVGIHGTDRPDLLPGYVSHGCIRLRNDDILRLARLMPVGTPVTIR
jgi:hypothetical protein